MIKLDNLHMTFNQGTVLENAVLKGVNLQIEQGEFITVIGSNGAGKSTLLNIIAGEYLPTRGKVFINNQEVTQLQSHERSHWVARVFQDPLAGTCSDLTIEENLALASARGRQRGLRLALGQSGLKKRFQETLARLELGLENRLHDRIGLLSGGQRQAVSLLMAALQPMQILLLDEHTAALDPKTAAFVLSLTTEIIEENKLTALMVTHSMKQAISIGTRTLMMDQGVIAFDIEGEERRHMQIADLLKLFEKSRGTEIDSDALLLG